MRSDRSGPHRPVLGLGKIEPRYFTVLPGSTEYPGDFELPSSPTGGPKENQLISAIFDLIRHGQSSPLLGKTTPIAASFNHLVGGSLHFLLLGYTVAHPVDAKGIGLSLFFGLRTGLGL
jgi:hypothetical protein